MPEVLYQTERRGKRARPAERQRESACKRQHVAARER